MPMLRMALVLASVLCSALVFSASASAIFKTAPEQIHTAFAGPDGLAVTWFTLNATATSTLKWGAASGQLDHTASGAAVSYGAEGLHHTVVIKGLAARTKYYYQCGDAAGGFSATQSVSTARAAGDATPFTVGIVGDMGTINGGPSTAGMIGRAAETEFTLHIGDISYADDTLEEFYEATWNDFMNRIQPLAANQAYMVLPGNHEATCSEVLPFECKNMHRNFTAYRNRFRMPFAESGAVNNMWHSFDYGLVHFVSISTETDFVGAPEGPGTYLNAGPFGDQIGWLVRDLQRAVANRAAVPWIVVAGHRPLYSLGGFNAALRELLEPLLLKFQVDLYFSGHVHWYERLFPVINGNVIQRDYNDPASPVYIVNGAGGNIEGPAKGGNVTEPTAYLNKVNFGFGQLSIESASQATWRFFRADTGAIDDQITLVKRR